MQGNSGSETDTSCVVDPDVSRQVISLQMCGNGIVEAGEDCDPGAGSNSTCCDPTTCKFTTNSVCDPASTSCCTTGCQFAPRTEVCRPAKNAACDTAEYCTGTSAACPADITAANGKSCGSGGLACAGGICTSLNRESFSCLTSILRSYLLRSAMSEQWRFHESYRSMYSQKRQVVFGHLRRSDSFQPVCRVADTTC